MNNGEDKSFEKCIVCGETTSTRKNMPIDFRDFYIDGCGQLCYNCYMNIFRKEEKKKIKLW